MTQRSSTAFRPDIQGLRAIAVLAVIAFHAGLPVPGGFVGVDIFFVISGFVITAMLHREWLSTNSIRFRHFYLRRFKRLTPALALMVSVTVLLSIPLLSPVGTQQVAAETAVGAMVLVANFVIASVSGGYFGTAADLNPLLNTWSLSVEEQFYLGFPALLALGWWAARKVRWGRAIPGALVLLVAVVSFGGALLNAAGHIGPRTELLLGFYGPVSRAWEFAVGALLALAMARFARMGDAWSWALSIGGAIAVVASLWVIGEETPFPGPWTLLPVLGTAALIAGGIPGPRGLSGLLGARPMVVIGDYSYSLYLWHWPFIVFASVLWPGSPVALIAAAALATLPAIASYRWVEQRFRSMALPGRRQLAGLLGATMLIPCLLAAGLWAGANRSWGMTGLDVAAAVNGEWEVLAQECMDLDTTVSVPSKVAPGGCTWNDEASGRPVYLVGDSAAAQYLSGVRLAAEETNSPLRMITAAHCPLTTALRVNEVTGQETDDACNLHNDEAMSLLTQAKPGIVLLANSNRYWYVDDDRFTLTVEGRDVDVIEGRRVLQQGIAASVEELQAAGHEVVMMAPTYTFLNGAMPTPERMPMFKLTTKGSSLKVAADSLEPGQEQARRAISDIAASTGAGLLDVTDWQCPQGECPAFFGDTPAYADSAHISQPAAALLAGRFVSSIGHARTGH